jgi:dipeptidyl aminopeptidase/acylaminoacyl peptidase
MTLTKQFACAIFLACAVAAPASSAAGEKVDPAFFGSLPDTVEVQISPDGKTVAALQTVNGEGVVLFRSVDDPGAKPTGVRVGSTDARTIEWADNEHLLLLLSRSEGKRVVGGQKTIEFFRWLSVSKSNQKAVTLFENEGEGYFISDAGDFIAMVPGKDSKALFSRVSTRGIYQRMETGTRISNEAGNLGYSLFEVDLDNGRVDLKEVGNEETRDWIADSNGEPFARIDYNEKDQQRRSENSYTLVKAFPEASGAGSVIQFHGLLDDGATLAASTYTNGKQALVAFDVNTGSIKGPIFSDPVYDIDSITYNPRTARTTAVHYIDDLPRTHHINEENRKLQQQLGNSIQGAAPMIVSSSKDGQRMIVEAIYPDHPKQFFLFDRAAKRLDMLASSYEKIDGTVFAKKEKFDYVSADGLKIPGYLTVPEGASKQNMPLIVLPHGGPETRADQSFDYWSFFYAARGYLVYEPNFRGSYGYGFPFRSAGYGEWGRKMQSDITDGVKKLIADGVADPDRICIVGGSYGGYAALAGATLTPDLYACAVSVNGVSDLPAMLGSEAKESPLSEDYWEVRLGGSRFSPAELNTVSPSQIADKAGAPILIIHAKDDVVVPVVQSRRMRGARQSANTPHEYVELKGEDHWLSTGEMRTEMLRLSIDFVDQHIGE